MGHPQLSIRSTRARELAHRLAAAERRTVSQVVEQALELYARLGASGPRAEPAGEFYLALTRDASADVDLDALVRGARRPHDAPDL